MIDGEQITLGGTEYTLPPLPLRPMAKVQPVMARTTDIYAEEYIEAFTFGLWASLKLNYPDITREQVENNVYVTNALPLMQAFMRVNGFIAKAADAPAGEPTADQ